MSRNFEVFPNLLFCIEFLPQFGSFKSIVSLKTKNNLCNLIQSFPGCKYLTSIYGSEKK